MDQDRTAASDKSLAWTQFYWSNKLYSIIPVKSGRGRPFQFFLVDQDQVTNRRPVFHQRRGSEPFLERELALILNATLEENLLVIPLVNWPFESPFWIFVPRIGNGINRVLYSIGYNRDEYLPAACSETRNDRWPVRRSVSRRLFFLLFFYHKASRRMLLFSIRLYRVTTGASRCTFSPEYLDFQRWTSRRWAWSSSAPN